MATLSLETLQRLFDVMPLGVVVMDDESRVVFYNRYEETLAGRRRENVVGKHFFEEVAPCTVVAGLGAHYRKRFGTDSLSRKLLFRFPRPHIPQPRDVRLSLSPLHADGRDLAVLFVEDVSAIRAVERTKDFLIRALAHDMHNPLTAARWTVEELQTQTTEEPSEAAIATVSTSLERLHKMVLDLFDITRLQTRTAPVDFALTDVGRVAHEVLESEGVAARSAGVELDISAEATSPAEIDAELVRRALGNLLDNALRFTPRGGKIVVRVYREDAFVVCEVQDQGPGVPEALRATIFEQFVRGGDSLDPSTHRGLGLAFVDLVAREHGGTVHVDCPPDGGSVFSLCLPVSQASAPAHPRKQRRDHKPGTRRAQPPEREDEP